MNGIRQRPLNRLRDSLLDALRHDRRLAAVLGVSLAARAMVLGARVVDLDMMSILPQPAKRSEQHTELGRPSSTLWGTFSWTDPGTLESPTACDAPWPAWFCILRDVVV